MGGGGFDKKTLVIKSLNVAPLNNRVHLLEIVFLRNRNQYHILVDKQHVR